MSRLLFILVLIFAGIAHAQSSPTKLALAEQVAALLQYDKMFDAYLKQCTQPEGSNFDPKIEFRASPGSFGGISPQSTYWPEIEKIYDHFRTAACNYATPERFSKYFIEQLAERNTEEDLRTGIAFYSSPAGKNLQASMLAANSDFQAFASRLMVDAYEVGRDRYQREVRELVRKYKADPK